MNVLSLFDGISCGLLALKRANIPVENYFSSEIDPVAIGISQSNWKNIIRLGDVKNVNVNDLPRIDLLIGGSPCQGFSNNGVGLNFEDPRSKLFFDFAKILNELKNKNPNTKFLLENVKMKDEWKDIITDYVGVDPIEINSKNFIPQNRSRLYWTNINVSPIPQQKLKLLDILEDIEITDYVVKDGLKIHRSFSDNAIELVNVVNGEVRISQATKQGYIVAEDGDGVNLSFAKSNHRRGRVIKGCSPCLDTSCNFGVFQNGQIRRFTINELERLQTLPKGYTHFIATHTPDNLLLPFGKTATNSQRTKVIGNGWTVDVISHILKGLI